MMMAPDYVLSDEAGDKDGPREVTVLIILSSCYACTSPLYDMTIASVSHSVSHYLDAKHRSNEYPQLLKILLIEYIYR